MIQIKIIEDKIQWEQFVLSQEYTLFTQSFRYGEFYERMGEKFWLFGIFENDKLLGGSLVVSVHAKRGNFLFLPYGPMIADSARLEKLVSLFFAKLYEFALLGNYDFIRVSPFLDDLPEIRQVFKKNSFRDAPMHILAEYTWMLDLSPNEETLLKNMDKNHRNLIRRCQKENVVVEKSEESSAILKFNKLHDFTALRHGFHRFSSEYIINEFNSFVSANESSVFNAYVNNNVLDSSAIIIYYGNMAAYRHGASLLTDKRLPTSYIVQWEAILEAKKRGIKWYNFWGIAPLGAPRTHPFYGISHFKKGFGGGSKRLINCQDLPVSKRYWLNWLVETFRSFRRGFN